VPSTFSQQARYKLGPVIITTYTITSTDICDQARAHITSDGRLARSTVTLIIALDYKEPLIGAEVSMTESVVLLRGRTWQLAISHNKIIFTVFGYI